MTKSNEPQNKASADSAQEPADQPSISFKLALGGSIALGVCLLFATFYVKQSPAETDSKIPVAATAELGRKILRETAAFLGPDQADPDKRYAGTHMACASCHLDTGTKPGTLSLQQAATRYPRMSRRDGGERDLRDRINGCMQRSMNGRALPRDSVEMIAMESYILSLGDQFAAMSETLTTPDEPEAFQEPDRKADVNAGQLVFQERCQVCHGANGEGLHASSDVNDGYLFPPLWGADSFNNGAGMTRVLTAARFIKARMPLGDPDLTSDQAYDVSAYMNSFERPTKTNLAEDFPELSNKPVDSPYPPYADPFSNEQHRLGPFAPIREYYEQLANE